MKTPLLLASALLLGACTSTDPDYGSHWNAGQAAVSAEHAFTGFDAEVSESRFEHQRDGAEGAMLTLRRHFMNDNPDNPLQMRRGWGNPDNPYNMTAGIADAGYLVRDGVISTGYVAATGLTMATDVIVGVPLAMFGVDYGGVSGFWEDGDTAPTPPEEFQTVNF